MENDRKDDMKTGFENGVSSTLVNNNIDFRLLDDSQNSINSIATYDERTDDPKRTPNCSSNPNDMVSKIPNTYDYPAVFRQPSNDTKYRNVYPPIENRMQYY